MLTLVGLLVAAIRALADPHSEGTELGKSNLSKLSSNVTSANAKSMPFYTDTPSQSSQFGSSSLFTVGTSRINSCKNEADGPDPIANKLSPFNYPRMAYVNRPYACPQMVRTGAV